MARELQSRKALQPDLSETIAVTQSVSLSLADYPKAEFPAFLATGASVRYLCYLQESSTPLQDVLRPLRDATSQAALDVQAILSELEVSGLDKCEILDLSNRGFVEEHAHWLSSILLKLPNLKVLKLEGNPIGPEGARAIARAIRGHRCLEILDLEDCKIGRIGARSILAAIQPPRTPTGPRTNIYQHIRKPIPVKILDLEGNMIDDGLAEQFPKFLRYNTTVEELDLEDNNLGDVTCEEIARSLSYNRSLKKLDLSGNHITSAGMDFLTRFFTSRTNVAPIESLNVSGNKIETQALDSFAKKAMKVNPWLKEVDLSDNTGSLSDEGKALLDNYLNRNRTGELVKVEEKANERDEEDDAEPEEDKQGSDASSDESPALDRKQKPKKKRASGASKARRRAKTADVDTPADAIEQTVLATDQKVLVAQEPLVTSPIPTAAQVEATHTAQVASAQDATIATQVGSSTVPTSSSADENPTARM